jgi:glutamate carboxypeptidase
MTIGTDAGDVVAREELDALRRRVDDASGAFIRDLERLVNVDCGSYTKAGVDEVGRFVATEMRDLGAQVDVRAHDTLGDTVIGTWQGGGETRLMLIGHMDTVFDPGTAAERPFRIDNGTATGPGVTDMKAGLLAGLYAIRAIRDELGDVPFGRLVFVANPDEEIGSPSSSPHIRELAREVDACLVLECARANGDIVSARKGVLHLRLVVHGRAAHAGVEPEKGRSAIVEGARLVRELHALNGRWPGVTVNVGVIQGGLRSNVVAERCTLDVDIRATARDDMVAAEAAIRELAASTIVPDVRIDIEDHGRHWPMEKLDRSGRLVDTASAIAARLGFDVRDAATGGASDANTTAGMGIPTIDGLGPVGGNDHAPSEYLEVDSIVPRTALLAGLLVAIGRDPVVAGWRS